MPTIGDTVQGVSSVGGTLSYFQKSGTAPQKFYKEKHHGE